MSSLHFSLSLSLSKYFLCFMEWMSHVNGFLPSAGILTSSFKKTANLLIYLTSTGVQIHTITTLFFSEDGN